MKVMVLIKASKDSEAGVMPSQQLLADMAKGAAFAPLTAAAAAALGRVEYR